MLTVKYMDKKKILYNNIMVMGLLDDNLSKRFLTGLKKHNVTYEEICKNWFYIGGEKGQHLKYYILSSENKELPKHKDYCLCNHKIKYNCFISNGTNILSLGNCCVNRFIPKKNRTCKDCGCNHRNRKINKCNICKIKINKTYGKYILIF